ncbi:MAG: sn-glycerol-3-phosphate ABC transporter ATP-binding protein UgpC [Betaproteobacteria bacterium RIFCSPLOWO2_12_FULL_62_13b]|nr:MAG: sn-glycerol-3-phosphate ABC transporter ATP-binding protein UgpC [Betaproteobacteria bacterium RIFCSPLOWO2_12_FULL_62_13b]
MSDVQLEQVSKVYPNGHVAVQDATFRIADGQLFVLVGPSGCGKSTLLRMIAGLESISSGTLTIDGRVVNDLPPKDRDIAMVFQNYALYPHMSVAENMAFGLKLRGHAKADIARKVREAAQMLGLGTVMDRRPATLSGGQRQRVALGRAIVRDPKVFLLDEPLSNLDAKLRLATRTEIARLQRRLRATMIYVTHDQIEAMTLGERIAVLKEGEIQQVGEPMEIYARPCNVFVAGFLGSPAMNLVPGVLENGHLVTGQGATSLRLAQGAGRRGGLESYEGRQIIVGMRPEDLRPVTSRDDDAQETFAFSARLENAEPVGNEIFLYLRFGAIDLVARVAPTPLARDGTSVSMKYAPGRLHFFDAQSGARIEAT